MTETRSLGEQLKNARENLELSIEEVVQKTNLKKNHIEAFENDIFILQNSPPAFVRGYVRNYIRFLRLPENLTDTVNYGQVTLANENKAKPLPPIKVNNHNSQRRWVRGLTWLVLLTAVGMTLTWWWQEHQKDQASRDELVNRTTEIAPANPLANEIVLDQANVPQNESISVTVPATAPIEDSSIPVENIINATNTDTMSQASVAIVAGTTSNEIANNSTNNTDETLNILQQLDNNTSTPETENNAAQVAITDELRIEIIGGQSWITVRGTKNKRLAEKLYNNGEVLTFNNNEQYRLTVGAPANVKIYYKGDVIPLKVDGRVARFKLPLVQ